MRKFNILCLAVAALITGCAKKELLRTNADGSPKTEQRLKVAGSAVGDVVGKLTVGYQGWFAAPGDGSPQNRWAHWAGGTTPAPGNQGFELWPDTREYTTTYQTGYANLGNGQPAKLFSSYTAQTVNKHFEWMQTYDIDCAALQRFGGPTYDDATIKGHNDGMALKVKTAAETYGRKFYIMYDVSGWSNMQSVIKTDWTNTIVGTLNLLSSPAYAKQNGKPVVCIFGMGYLSAPNPGPGDPTACLDVINWFKAQGCYVIGSVPMDWRNPNNVFSRNNFASVYNAFNMLAPWAVGAEVNSTYQPWIQGDYDYCEAHGIDYQPIAYPGFAWSNWNGGAQNAIPRNHGDFMWSQASVMKTVGAKSLYVAMFDEYDEGTAIAKAAENASMKPTNQYFLSLDADGVAVSSDFYLRLAQDAGKLIKGQIPAQAIHPTPHIVGGAGPIANGTYKIINRNSGLAVDAAGQLTANGTAIDQWTYNGGANQKWVLTSLGGNIYSIVGVQSNRALDVAGQSVANGALIQLYENNGGPNQKWEITPTTGGYYSVKSVQSGKALDVPGQSTAGGVQLDQWQSDGGTNQQWAFQAP
jgi:hypothetical protein